MQLSALLVVAAVATSAFALPQPVYNRAAVNLNQGSDRLLTDVGNGQFDVDGLIFTDSSLAAQVACVLDERDCKEAGKGNKVCANERVSCQGGNGINGQTALLNNEQP